MADPVPEPLDAPPPVVAALAAPVLAPPEPAPLALHECPACASPLVQPVAWWTAGPAHWHLERRCPECAWHHHGLHDQAAMSALDAELDRGQGLVLGALRSVVTEQMADDVERFAAALQADHVLPEDF